ncbi:hypothetical protein LTR10_019007 [Elasticomyces elasticus]|uniref:SAP domain-containing protein n=1 Tax=Exophiala sideris TaxID=1016849 RepID=A0ABR0J3C4_9EURO|nr:hypothetical protein LTR10_019007 [Elasticomyces elasticus]KAK5026626.1 hypothetical protein LTS07_007560 [Exophiala sideris]KAK5033633.1 hypothetical protein LTR13_006685 [Exophiala sideris]KAK5055456.1 hypothetical protein LTR69_008289 [Exophiala sideris]KAK5176457.1 hypothetical protein LTR44_011018 [Eurotiomycetes sp. CCFEE 6388]
MVDYAKKTVAELQEILKSRSLSHTGKKAELIARLNEADEEAAQNEATKAPPAEATSAPPAQVIESTAEPTAEPAAAAPDASAAEHVETTDPAAAADTEPAPAASDSYALHLPTSEVDAELAKRKARAERFGTANEDVGAAGTEDADTEAARALERAKRFGTGQTAMGKLDEALPSEFGRAGRKRGRTEETSAMDDPALRRNFSGRGRGGGRGGRFRGRGRDDSRRRTGERPTGVAKSSNVFSSEADRLAAEARKQKFASAT